MIGGLAGLAAGAVIGNKIVGAEKSIKGSIDKVNKNVAKWGAKKKFKPKVKQDEYAKKVERIMGINK